MLPHSATLAICPWPQKADVANHERHGRQRPLSGFDTTLAKSAAFVQSFRTYRFGREAEGNLPPYRAPWCSLVFAHARNIGAEEPCAWPQLAIKPERVDRVEEHALCVRQFIEHMKIHGLRRIDDQQPFDGL
jgi:hypothetical protein